MGFWENIWGRKRTNEETRRAETASRKEDTKQSAANPVKAEPASAAKTATATRSIPQLSLASVDGLLREKVGQLKSGSVTKSDFLSSSTAGMTPELYDRVARWADLNRTAAQYKRQGDLFRAHRAYCESLKIEPKFDSAVIWGWVKVLLLAKEWDEAARLLDYHEAMMVVWMRIMRDEGNNQYFRDLELWGRKPRFAFDYDLGESLRENCSCALSDKHEVEEKIASYGGTPYWQERYRLTDKEFQDFIRVFPAPRA